MNIPIENIYFLLCYAWNMLDEGEVIDVSSEEMHSAADLLARVLESGTAHLLKRGLDRGYISEEMDTGSIRGKLDVGETVKRNLLMKAQVHCHIDSFSYDVLQNQIVKTTIGQVMRCVNIDRERRDRLVRVYRRMEEVQEIELSLRAFDSVVLHRNNSFYRFLLQVCRLVFQHHLVDQQPGDTRFRDFLRDEVVMRRLFENFVRNFYIKEQTEYRVGSNRFGWQQVVTDPEAAEFLPLMITDTCLTSTDKRIVIDTKYTARVVSSSQYGKATLRSEHLYQLYAYLRNLDRRDGESLSHEGVLLYPKTVEHYDLRYIIQGFPIRICTIDLNQHWEDIHRDLLGLVGILQ